ncbi:DNA-binding LytR/AlgR family response regulator [Pedobacter sp. AK017]|uniref:LytR/AlgR family response regulator transcription factor n=1 Tax=Pedobacter sp. AK017 TaxID=2723073 RepID=UPI00160E21F4|nr:LytTR family DNA-binding domain-containing protein [Pedobacter sp. AK017]MBB5441282.1 DNA-binding LytR/AlgR family response regulator [Pedobacter sp. AK017]
MNAIDQPVFFIQSEGKGKFVKIKKEQIIYVESALNYVHIHLQEQSYLTYLTIYEMQDILPPGSFKRVHKSFIINLDAVVSLQANFIYLSNGARIALGPNYRKDFFDTINPLMLKSKRQTWLK